MGKFARPTKPTQADIERVIQGADAADGRQSDKPTAVEGEVRFTMTVPTDMAAEVDVARKRLGNINRLAWIRLAMREKLDRDAG